MQKYDSGCGSDDGRAKDLTGMDENCVQCASGDETMALNPSSCVEQQDDEALHVAVVVGMRRDVIAPIGRRFVGRVAQLHFSKRWAFAQCLNLEFLGVEVLVGLSSLARDLQQCRLNRVFHVSLFWLALC